MTSAFIRLRRGLSAVALWLATICAAPASTPAPVVAPATWCPLAVNVHPLDARRIGLTFTTPGVPGPVSGMVALFAGAARYDIPFRALALRDDQRFGPQTILDPATALVVRAQPGLAIDAAVVTELDGRACRPAYQPWLAAVHRTPTPAAVDEALRHARTIELPRASAQAAAACAHPDAAPVLLHPVELNVPVNDVPVRAARAILLVTIDQAGAVLRSRVLQSSGSDAADAVAVHDTSAARFSPGTFRCEPDVSTYTFAFSFE